MPGIIRTLHWSHCHNFLPFLLLLLLHWIPLSSFNNVLNFCPPPLVFFNYFLNSFPSPIVLFQSCSEPLLIFVHLTLLDSLIFPYLFLSSFNYFQTCRSSHSLVYLRSVILLNWPHNLLQSHSPSYNEFTWEGYTKFLQWWFWWWWPSSTEGCNGRSTPYVFVGAICSTIQTWWFCCRPWIQESEERKTS